jgi:hypothetical protein
MIVATARSMGIQVVEDTLPPEPIRVDLWNGTLLVI